MPVLIGPLCIMALEYWRAQEARQCRQLENATGLARSKGRTRLRRTLGTQNVLHCANAQLPAAILPDGIESHEDLTSGRAAASARTPPSVVVISTTSYEGLLHEQGSQGGHLTAGRSRRRSRGDCAGRKQVAQRRRAGRAARAEANALRTEFKELQGYWSSRASAAGVLSERAIALALEGRVKVCISKPIVHEALRILATKFARAPEQLARTAIFLTDLGESVTPWSKLAVLSDEPDNRILECAAAGRADAIVTGDKALLALRVFEGIRVLSLRQFLNEMDAPGD